MGNIIYDLADKSFNTEYVADNVVKILKEKYERDFEVVKIGERYGTGFTDEVTLLCTVTGHYECIFKVVYKMEQIPTITNAVANVAASTVGKVIYQKEDGSIGFKLPTTERAKDDYRNAQTTFDNFKIKCGDMIDGMVDCVIDYASDILDKLPDIQNDNLAFAR